MNPKRLTKDKVEHRIEKVHGDMITIDFDTFISVGKKARFIDKELGHFYTTPNQIFSGKKHPRKMKRTVWTEVEIQKEIDEVHGVGVITLVPGTFRGMNPKCKFIHESIGEYQARPEHVIRGIGPWPLRQSKIESTNLKRFGTKNPFQNAEIKEKIKLTNQEKYGVDNPTQNRVLALKAARSTNNSYIELHWKTQQELVCTGKYERNVVRMFNNNKINFEWQPKTFNLLNGQTYRPDLYLPDTDIWVEIKGWLRPKAAVKMELFSKMVSKFEIWNRKVLISMGLVTSRGLSKENI